ncbi:MAG: hypothetical protein JK586_09260 [Nocardiopsis sp. BM-2018]|nr:MAG: hypothetical protein JK586_09260 [Nocardiopsis sp. BM-2018]
MFKMAFWVCYDHMGKLMAANFVAAAVLTAAGLPALAALHSGDPALMLVAGAPFGALALGVVLPVALAGCCHLCKELIETRDGSLRTFFEGVWLHGLRAAGLGLVVAAGAAVSGCAFWFYAVRIGAEHPLAGHALGALALWAFAGLTVCALLALPAVVHKRAGPIAALRIGAALAADNPLMAAALAFHAGLIAAAAFAPPILFFAAIAAAAALMSSAYEMLARKYAALAAWREEGDTGRPFTLEFHDAEDDYLNRGFRDFLFPWKS